MYLINAKIKILNCIIIIIIISVFLLFSPKKSMISKRDNSRNDEKMVVWTCVVFMRLVNVEELWIQPVEKLDICS